MLVSKTKHSKDRSTKHPNVENEAAKSRKRSTQKLENEDP